MLRASHPLPATDLLKEENSWNWMEESLWS